MVCRDIYSTFDFSLSGHILGDQGSIRLVSFAIKAKKFLTSAAEFGEYSGKVLMETLVGRARIIDILTGLTGEPLPRIC
jgi:hypothetical protein